MASSFSKRLKREVLGSPKKAVALGLLCLVAVYYWAPLLSGWFKGSDVSVMDGPVIATTTSFPSNPAASTVAATATTYSWKQIAGSLDLRSQQTPPPAGNTRDPFQMLNRKSEQAEVVAVETKVKDIAPDDVGLALSSTLVGPRSSVALIGGEAYQIGDEVPGATDAEVTFVVKSIHPRHIVLERAGHDFELALKRPELASTLLSSQRTTNSQDTEPVDE